MAQGKKSFVVYSDWKHIFDELPNEDAGALIKHIFAYVNDENPTTESILIRAVFANIKATLKRDLEKWNNTKLSRSETGRLGGIKSGEARRSKLNQTEGNEANALKSKQAEGNEAVNVTVNVSDSVNVIEDNQLAKANLGFDKPATDTETIEKVPSSRDLLARQQQSDYAKLKETAFTGVSVAEFINAHKPVILDPYADLWNFFASKNGIATIQKLTDGRKRKLKVRIGEEAFDLPKILTSAREQKFAMGSKWFTFDFVIENDTNYVKILEKKYVLENGAKEGEGLKAPNT